MASAALRCPFCGRGISRDVFSSDTTAACPHCGRSVAVEQCTLGFPDEFSARSGRPLTAAACVVGAGLVVAVLLVSIGLWRTPEGQVAGESPARAEVSPAPSSPLAIADQGVPPVPPANGASAVPAAGPGAGPAAGQRNSKPDEGEVCYRWKEGEVYCYRFSCKAQGGGYSAETSGTNTYRVGRLQEAAPASTEPPIARQGSGTAFVIASDGYLVTCAHVVRNATDIKVTLGGQTTSCDVVARDDAHDLALIHTARKGLPVVPLADSEKVELAEEVRAIGYPLSDVLGSSLKVTQGSVAGIATQRRGKMFQIDAAVNPGNSGGPLVNGRGAVVGVVSAHLVGIDISEVGFAVPINYAKTLLEQHRVGFQKAAAGSKLDGPTLVKGVAPSVGLVTMTCHGGDSDSQDRIALYYHAIVESNRHAGSAQPVTPERDDGKLVVDDLGEVFECNGHVNLPCLLGPVASMVIDPFSANGEKTWQRQQALTIVSSRGRSMDPFAGLRPPGYRGPRGRFGPPFRFGPFSEPERPSEYPAIQQATYTMADPQGTTISIRKRLELKTLERGGSSPRIELSGSGETLFDLKAGVPQKITFSGTFTVREGSDATQVPVTFTCERTRDATVAQSPPAATPSPAMPATTPSPATPAAAAPPPRESAESAKSRLDGYLEVLRATDRDWTRCFEALQGLAVMQPIEARRDEVAGVLDTYLAEKSYSARSSALRAAQVWGTKRNVPALMNLLRPSEPDSVRRRAVEVLDRFGDERAARAFAELVKSPGLRDRAARALRTIGRGAESAVLPLLAHEDPEVRAEACNVLAEIGGTASAAALKEQLAKETETSVKTAAKKALEKVQKAP